MTLANQSLSWVKNRWVVLGAIALLAVFVLTLAAAPTAQQATGSSFNRAPDGYGAWYAYMQNQGATIERWRRPFADLEQRLSAKGPITLLQVNSSSSFFGLSDQEKQWVEQGNRLVILGIDAPVTQADFSTAQSSPVGAVKVETRRRFQNAEIPFSPDAAGESLLSDRFGAVVWGQQIGNGEAIYATTPFLAANAYQDEPGNYPFLARIVSEGDRPIWVDEYIHGYKENDVITEEVGGESWRAYLANTPLLPALVQITILLIVLIWANNQRFGAPTPLTAPTIDNSKAYIEALASVLQKAESTEFILDVVGKEEQLQLQKSLGLGTTPLDPASLVDAWTRQTGRSPAELEQIFRPYWQKRRLSEADLKTWLTQLQTLHRHPPSPYRRD